MRCALRSYVLPTPRRERERPDEIAVAVRWLEKASLPVGELAEMERVHTETRPRAGKAWTDSGETHDRRGLKQRPAGEVRIVPIPPPLVRMLSEQLKDFGTWENPGPCVSAPLVTGSLGTSERVPPAGFEPAHTAPEAVALSPELRGRVVLCGGDG